MRKSHIASGLWEALNRAVDESYRTVGLNGTVPRARIAEPFIEQGAPRSSVFRRIDDRLRQLRIERAAEEEKFEATFGPVRPPDKPMPPLPPLPPVKRVAQAVAKVDSEITVEAIPFLHLFQENLRELGTILALAKNKDGSIRNARLAQSVVDSIGKQLGLAARVQQVVEARQRQEEFMQGLVDIVLRQEPAVRDKLVAEMQALRLRYGADPR